MVNPHSDRAGFIAITRRVSSTFLFFYLRQHRSRNDYERRKKAKVAWAKHELVVIISWPSSFIDFAFFSALATHLPDSELNSASLGTL